MDARANGGYHSYFLPCDGHRSAHGDQVRTNILLPWLNYKNSGAAR
jgi:hypothetical protein